MVRVDFNNAKVDLSLNVRRVFFSTFDRSELNESYEKVSKIYDYLVKKKVYLKLILKMVTQKYILDQHY